MTAPFPGQCRWASWMGSHSGRIRRRPRCQHKAKLGLPYCGRHTKCHINHLVREAGKLTAEAEKIQKKLAA